MTLRKLNISSNKFSGPLPLKLGHCAIIDLSNNMLSGNLSRIKYWGNYVELIQLSSNSLSGTLPNETSQFLRLTSLNVSNNSLEGFLPPVLGTYLELKVIDLSLNQLSGFLLPALFASTKLTTLNLSNNKFSGPIPFQLPNNNPLVLEEDFTLTSLDLSHNTLSGNLSSNMKELHNLSYLNLCNNKLEGTIPNDLPDALRGFNVSFNNFSGVVPDNLLQFPESAFHPGNTMLIFPNSQLSSPKDSSNIDLKEHGSHKKTFTRSVLITCLVTFSFVIAIISAMVCYRIHQKKEGTSKQDATMDDIIDKSASPSKREESKRNVESLPPLDDSENIHTTLKGLKDLEFVKNEEGTSSPMSNPSSSTSHQFENPSDSLKVSSPDKLVGDLHLFDGSLMLTPEELSLAPAEVVGRSCHGTLYKATLESGHVLAVKWLREGITKGKKELAREMKKLGTIKHPSLVSFLGCYVGPKEHERLIISNYMNAHSLDIYLHGKIIMTSYWIAT